MCKKETGAFNVWKNFIYFRKAEKNSKESSKNGRFNLER